jgi:hypothetical protein
MDEIELLFVYHCKVRHHSIRFCDHKRFPRVLRHYQRFKPSGKQQTSRSQDFKRLHETSRLQPLLFSPWCKPTDCVTGAT